MALIGNAAVIRPDPAAIQTQELTSRHIGKAPKAALPMANTTITKLTNTPGTRVCVTQPKTMDSRFNASMSQKSGLRGWYKRLSFMSDSVPGELVLWRQRARVFFK